MMCLTPADNALISPDVPNQPCKNLRTDNVSCLHKHSAICCWYLNPYAYSADVLLGMKRSEVPETKQGGSCSPSCCFYPHTQWALPVCPCHQVPCALHRAQVDGLSWDLTRATDHVWIVVDCITDLSFLQVKEKVFSPLSYPHHGSGG